MPRLTQALFAERLREAMAAAGLRGIDLAERGIPTGTVSRWRRPTYIQGPPKPAQRRRLEFAIGLPAGAFDTEDAGVWERHLNRLKRPRVGRAYDEVGEGRLATLRQLLSEITERVAIAQELLSLPRPSQHVEAKPASANSCTGKEAKLRRRTGKR